MNTHVVNLGVAWEIMIVHVREVSCLLESVIMNVEKR